jgi:hypothetical protein
MSDGRIRVGIVGGGKGGNQILQLFSKSQSVEIAFVCDINSSAPAMVAARALEIDAYTSLDAALACGVPFIFEATGSKKVVQMIGEKAGPDVRIIEHETAHLLISVMSDIARVTNAGVIQDVREVKQGILDSATRINSQMRSIESITSGLHIVGLNARIEAARIGGEGAGFDVVAQEVQKSAHKVRTISEEITSISDSIVSLSAAVDKSLARLSTTDWEQAA